MNVSESSYCMLLLLTVTFVRVTVKSGPEALSFYSGIIGPSSAQDVPSSYRPDTEAPERLRPRLVPDHHGTLLHRRGMRPVLGHRALNHHRP